jgi:hypothetical protein
VQRKGARALLAMYTELGPDVELETCGGVGRRPGAPGDDPTIWEARARWVAGKQDWRWVGSEVQSPRISDVGHAVRREHVGAGVLILGGARRAWCRRWKMGRVWC